MIKKYAHTNWQDTTPKNLLEYLHTPVPRGVKLLNFIVQKVFGINKNAKFMVHYTSTVNGNIHLGINVVKYLAGSGGCYIQGINSVSIGDYTMIAPGVKIISANHSISNFDCHEKVQPIVIGKSCWLGTNSVILPGVTLGNNVIVAAGSVVTKSFEGNVIIAGVPAKIIKNR